tara:strand:- start:2750 stop:3664 length:915 start_codon:yes stop_codon:yes gene_type:complete
MGQESNWGVAAGSQTVYNRVMSIDMSRTIEREQRTHLTTSNAAFSFGSFDAFEIAGGSITVPVQYDGTGILIYNALGATPTTTGSDPYIHTYTPSTEARFLTIQCQRGSGTMEAFLGCMVSTMNISIESGQQMEAEFEFIAKTSNNRTSAITSPNFGSGLPVNHYESGTLSFDSQTYSVRSISLNLDNKLERRNLLGSKQTAQPAITDIREITLDVVADWEDDNLYNAQYLGTAGDVVITFTNSAGHYFKITLNEAQLTSYEDNVDSVGRIERSFTFQGFATSGGNAAFEIEIKNTSISAVANG